MGNTRATGWLALTLALHSCATVGRLLGNDSSDPAPLVFGATGEHPTVCYVRARHFAGLVPVSCAEAQMIRP